MRIGPDFFLRSFCWLALLALVASIPHATAQRRHGSGPLDTLGENPSQKDGWEVLQKFRSLGIANDYALRFQLRIMPRREKTRTVPGVLYGTNSEQGPLTRIDVVLEEATIGDDAALVKARAHRLLLQNGIFASAVESLDSVDSGQPREIPVEERFRSIAGSNFTVFDLLMPFTYWQRFRYEGRTTFRGRPAHVFWMYPPKEDKALARHVSGVRIYLDEEFYALIQAEIFGADETLAKTLTIVDFKKVDEEWILSQVDVRDEKTRDKTRFKVIDAEMNVDLPPNLFSWQRLAENVYGADLAPGREADAAEPAAAPAAEGHLAP